MNEIETARATPEQLLQMIETRMAMQRAQRAQVGRNRLMFMVGGVLFIVIGAGVALMVLSQMVSGLQTGERRPTAQTKGEPANGKF